MAQTNDQLGEYVTQKYLQQFFGVHRSTIHRWVKSGKLKAYRFNGIRMFKLSEIEEEIENGKETITE